MGARSQPRRAHRTDSHTAGLERLAQRLRIDAGQLRLAVGIRETGTDAEVGADGGTSGTIEWIGVAEDINGAPQGVLVEPLSQGGVSR